MPSSLLSHKGAKNMPTSLPYLTLPYLALEYSLPRTWGRRVSSETLAETTGSSILFCGSCSRRGNPKQILFSEVGAQPTSSTLPLQLSVSNTPGRPCMDAAGWRGGVELCSSGTHWKSPPTLFRGPVRTTAPVTSSVCCERRRNRSRGRSFSAEQGVLNHSFPPVKEAVKSCTQEYNSLDEDSHYSGFWNLLL
jgi:hypothetical protein